MIQHIRTYAIMIAVVPVIPAVIFLLPPLTTSETPSRGEVDQAVFEQAFTNELAHCEEETVGIDCACFAGTSGYILAQDQPKVPFIFYADQTELARGQATERC